MKLERKLGVPVWSAETAEVAARYLRSRGFLDVGVSAGPVVAGTRGSWLGNFTSFDMTKLRARVQLSPASDGVLALELDVNTVGQQITEWNRAVWRLEIVELHRLLRGLGEIGEIWDRFKREDREAAKRWIFTFAVGGRRLPEAWVAELRALEIA